MRFYTPQVLAVLCIATFVVFAVGASGASASESAASFRAKMEKWVQTRQILSEETADWLLEKESLQATRDFLRRERDDLRAEIAEFEAAGATADDERRELLAQRSEYQASAERMKESVEILEREVLEIAPQLPEPLQNRLDLLLVQIPEDPEKSDASLGSRLMNVLGVLAQTEKWNSTATLIGETRAIGESDQKVQMRSLYWGLGQVVYVDILGEVAGVGRPTKTGWEFVEDRSLASDAKMLLDIYEGNVDTISFIPVPVDLR